MENEELLQRIEKLERWKLAREKQQITLPLDQQSINVLMNYFMRLTGGYSYEAGAGGHTFIQYFGQQNQVENLAGQARSPAYFEIGARTAYRYSISSIADNEATIVGTTIADGNRFYITTTDTVPGGLDTLDTYFAIEVTPTKFKFSLDGVTPIDITDAGTGVQFLTFF